MAGNGSDTNGNGNSQKRRRLALVASKGSLDMAYPPLILASTAVAMGWEVAVFFTFYGIQVLSDNVGFPAPGDKIVLQAPKFNYFAFGESDYDSEIGSRVTVSGVSNIEYHIATCINE